MAKKKNDPCRGCFYYGGNSDAVKCCSYFLTTGIRRPCPPGEGCTVKKTKQQVKAEAIARAHVKKGKKKNETVQAKALEE